MEIQKKWPPTPQELMAAHMAEWKAKEDVFRATAKLSYKHGGQAIQIHDRVDIRIPKENLEAFLAEAKELNLM